MTLDEAIKHAEEVAEENENNAQIWHKQTKNRLVDFCDKAIQAENNCIKCAEEHRQLAEWLKELKQLREQTRWIPISKGLPKDLEPVNITWVNHNPGSDYADIKDKAFTATGVYFNGQWYWWSTLCTDILAEYSHNYDDVIDDDIEIIAWQPLPLPYKAD